MKKLKLNLGKQSYFIFIHHDNFKELVYKLENLNLPNRAVIVTMGSLAKLYQEDLVDRLDKNNFKAFVEIVPDSENSKSFLQLTKSIKNISGYVKSNPFFLIAFGGGVVGDLCGFIASIYKRGVDYIQVPTTLLSQVDSSIGGKVGIDLSFGKNLVGAFYHPRLVYTNIKLLESLPERELRSGIAEVIKYGVIQDKHLFKLIENLSRSEDGTIYNDIKQVLEEMVYKCAKIKSKIVSCDEKDTKGIRAKLNFGHTIGHAVEAASEYSKFYTHGEAISIGMMCATEISKDLGILKEDILDRLESILKTYDLPVYIRNLEISKLMESFWYDKKFIRGSPRMVLPIKLGKVKVVDDIPIDVVEKVVNNRIKLGSHY